MIHQHKKYADVIVDISHEAVDRPFQYKIPDALQGKLCEGMEVMIPFGRGNTLRSGYVTALTDTSEWPEDKMKEIYSVNENAIGMEGKMLALAAWMKKRYGSTMISAMQTVLPVKRKVKDKTYKTIVCLLNNEELGQQEKSCHPLRHAARLRLLRELYYVKEMPYSMATEKLNVSPSVLKTLEKNKVIEIRLERTYRNPIISKERQHTQHELNSEQKAAVQGVLESLKKEQPGTSLLFGITGSGKTEVYMELIADVVGKGKQAIVLIPEIALTFQTLIRFYSRFHERVSVLHSRLSEGERYDQMERARKGELDIIIGPRSALFTPFPQLGIIIIDEEHEGSYKSEKMPKYHAREVAEYIAKREHAALVLGSATPSLESYYKAKQGEYQLYRLTKRPDEAVLPAVYTVDMREELKNGNRSLFSNRLKELMTECLVQGNQMMLFINRRGYAGFVSCRECGYVLKCPHCDVSLSQHGFAKMPYGNKTGMAEKMVCHYCGYEVPAVKRCPECQSKFFAGFKAGTEKVEEELKKWNPSLRVLRMDADTTKKKEDYEAILSSFADKEADVLVGTQMIVKGHDFKNVTLVGILAADLSLFSADFKAAERTFQLVTQAAGRAGRGKKGGQVVIQTYKPDHYSLIHAAKQDYLSFYEEEMLFRDLAGYPPACHMLAVQFFSVNCEDGSRFAKKIAERLQEKNQEQVFTITGPAPAVLSKIKDIYRNVIYLKASDDKMLTDAMEWIQNWYEEEENTKISIQFDMDPNGTF